MIAARAARARTIAARSFRPLPATRPTTIAQLMSNSWLIYTTASRPAAESAVETMYETLGGIVGEDLAEHLDPGEELEPPSLGSWPDVSVLDKVPVPTADEARASIAGSGKGKAKLDEAALERLASCKATIQIAQA